MLHGVLNGLKKITLTQVLSFLFIATAYGLLLHEDRFGSKGQTRVNHHENR